jgi:hypothetical protein
MKAVCALLVAISGISFASMAAGQVREPEHRIISAGGQASLVSDVRYMQVNGVSEVATGVRRAWVWAVDAPTGDPQQQWAAAILYEYDCAQQRSRALQIIVYEFDGSALDPETPPNAWAFPPPTSRGFQELRFACTSESERRTMGNDATFERMDPLTHAREIMFRDRATR